MKPAILALAAVAPLLLSACGIPDLVAHGVKSYEHGVGSPDYGMTRQQPVQVQPQPASYNTPARLPDPEPPMTVEMAPPRQTVVSEPLP